MKKFNFALFFVILTAFVSILIYTVIINMRYSENKAVVELIPPMQLTQNNKDTETAEIIIKDLILKEIEKHKGLQVIINAKEGKIIHSDDKIECIQVKCYLCTKHKQIADLMASNAKIDKANKNVFLTGNTIVHFDDITINSQAVSYNYSNQKLITDKQTKYEHPNFSLLAQHSKINLRKNTIKMCGGVKSKFLNCPTKD